MRLNILAFATGITCLQFQAELPGTVAGLALAGCVIAAASILARRSALGRLLAVLACFLGGFGFAAWRAEIRLAEELPAAWEAVSYTHLDVYKRQGWR